MNPGVKIFADTVNSWVVPLVFLFIVVYGYSRKVKVYEVFVDGAKEGLNVAFMIIPYLVVILSAIAIFRASGAMDFVARAVSFCVPPSVFPPDTVLMALVKPLSGSAARGVMLDIFQRHGVDSFTGFLASTIEGSTETTFYVIAVYYGAVGVKNTRHTIPAGLIAESMAVATAVLLANIWFMGQR
jgi:spore maturation protein B